MSGQEVIKELMGKRTKWFLGVGYDLYLRSKGHLGLYYVFKEIYCKLLPHGIKRDFYVIKLVLEYIKYGILIIPARFFGGIGAIMLGFTLAKKLDTIKDAGEIQCLIRDADWGDILTYSLNYIDKADVTLPCLLV